MTDNAADRKSIRAKEKLAKLDEENDRNVVVALMQNYGGRAWIWRRLESANVFTTVYNDSAQRMAFNEGIRVAGLDLLQQIMVAAPDQFIQAMREANGRRSDRDSIDNRNPGDPRAGEYARGADSSGGVEGSDPESDFDSGAGEGSGDDAEG